MAGADIKEFVNLPMEEGFQLSSLVINLTETIENCPKPIIAAINGYALGGGLELAMACHLRIASENSKMGLPEVSLGLIPGYGGTQRLPQLIGKGRALDMIMTGKMINADQALDYGLINYKTTSDELMTFIRSACLKNIIKPSNAIKHSIKSINAYDKSRVDGFKVEMNEFGKCFQTNDFVKGTTAFLNKTKPDFNSKIIFF